jgi:glycosyltransferase involved in cell wall biosynthesis
VIPHIRLRKWEQDPDQVKANAEVLKKELYEILKPYDIIITHDLIYQEAYIAHNIAIHDLAARLPHIKWLHWIHSGPKLPRVVNDWPRELLHKLPPNSKIVYMNEADALRIAESYGTTLDNVRVVHNTKDVGDFFEFTDEAKKLLKDNNILSADIIQTFPFSTPRHDGKQIKKVIKLFGCIKGLGHKVKLILCNAHGNRHPEVVQELKDYGVKCNLNNDDLIITSEQGFIRGVPRKTVANLFQISDLFVFPSTSEVCPNVLLEAAVAGNFLVINESLPCLKEFTGTKALNNWGFSSAYTTVSFPNKQAEEKWYKEVASIIVAELIKERSYHTRKFAYRHFNFKYIFEKQFLPMISEL